MSKKPWRVVRFLFIVLVLMRTGISADKATTQSADQIMDWLVNLTHRDAEIREEAFDSLLHLKREDLPLLRQAVASSRPIAAAQAALLQEIVSHVYLSEEPYEAEPGIGFLGLRSPSPERVLVFDADENPPAQPNAGDGVPIDKRLPGFCGFEAFRSGDVLLGIVGRSDGRLRRWVELTNAVQQTLPGETLTFDLIRDGKQMQVSVTIDARPVQAGTKAPADAIPVEELLGVRQERADKYWDEHFAPLLEGDA